MKPSPENFGRVLQRVAAAHSCTELAVFCISSNRREFSLLYHLRGGARVNDEKRAAAIKAFSELIQTCVEAGKDGAIEIAPQSRLRFRKYCLVSLVRRAGSIVGAIAAIAYCQDAKAAREALETIQREIQEYREWPPGGFFI